MRSPILFSLLTVSALLASAPRASAISNYSPSDLAGLTDNGSKALIKTVAVGANHRALLPARPLGMVIGLEAGLEVSAISLPDEFVSTLASVASESAASIPTVIPVPRVSLHKGLPGGVDVGFSYASYRDYFKIYGGDLQWAFVRGGLASPSIAARLGASYNKLFFMETHTTTIDLVASKNFYVIEPYVGAGVQFWSGDLSLGAATGLPLGTSTHQSATSPHVFFGLPIKLLFLKFTGEVDRSFAGVTSYGGKISLAF